MTWQAQAKCREADLGIFFPGPRQSTRPAKAICAECPVVDECREYALGVPALQGVWGGLSENERDRLRKRRGVSFVAVAQCGTRSGYDRHQRRGEKACPECMAANAAKKTRWRNGGLNVAPGFGRARA